jgi:hypothetical protein
MPEVQQPATSFMTEALNALTAAARDPSYYTARDAYNQVCTYIDSIPWNRYRGHMNEKINPVLADMDSILYDMGSEGQLLRSKYGLVLKGEGDKVTLMNVQVVINELRRVINSAIYIEKKEHEYKEPWWE